MENLIKNRIKKIASSQDVCDKLNSVYDGKFTVNDNVLECNTETKINYVNQFGSNVVDKKIRDFLKDKLTAKVIVQVTATEEEMSTDSDFNVDKKYILSFDGNEIDTQTTNYDGRAFNFDKMSQMATDNIVATKFNEAVVNLLSENDIIDKETAEKLKTSEFLK